MSHVLTRDEFWIVGESIADAGRPMPQLSSRAHRRGRERALVQPCDTQLRLLRLLNEHVLARMLGHECRERMKLVDW
eukprot:1613688-Prymnesium_polylepis.1